MAAVLNKFHHVGTFLFFACFVLMLVVSISAPRVNHLGLLRVYPKNGGHSVVNYGSFGYCLTGSGGPDKCSGSHIGYKIALLQSQLDNTHFASSTLHTLNGLTNVMVLHPIACALCFIAFAFTAGAGILGSLLGTITALLAWLVVFVVMIIDFIVMGAVKDHVNGKNGTGSKARFGAAMWLVLATFILLIPASVIIFLSCCSKRREHKVAKEERMATTTHSRRRFRNPFSRSRV